MSMTPTKTSSLHRENDKQQQQHHNDGEDDRDNDGDVNVDVVNVNPFEMIADDNLNEDVGSSKSDSDSGSVSVGAGVMSSAYAPSRFATLKLFIIQNQIQLYAAMFLCQLCWSGVHVISRVTVNYIHPLVVPAFRSSLTSLCLFAYVYRSHREFVSVDFIRRHYKILIFYGLTGAAFNNLFFNLGLLLTSASDAGLTQPLIPVLTLLLSVLLGRERGHVLKFVGVLLSVLGCASIVLGESLLTTTADTDTDSGGVDTTSTSNNFATHTATERAFGLTCFLIQTLIFAFYIVAQKSKYAANMPPIVLVFYTFAAGCPFTIVFALAVANQVSWSTLPYGLMVVFLLYIVLIGSIAAFSFFSYATAHLPASVSSMAITFAPVLTPLLGAIFLGEVLNFMHLIGGTLIVTGVAVVVWARHREQKQILQNQHQHQEQEEQEPNTQDQNEAAASTQVNVVEYKRTDDDDDDHAHKILAR